MTTHHLPERSWIFILLIYLCFIYLPFIIARSNSAESFLKGDDYYYRAVIISLVEDRDLRMENNVPTDPLNGELAVGQEGFVPKHPILMPLVSMPLYIIGGTPGLLVFNIFDCMILIVLIFKLNRLFHNHLVAFITTVLYATGTLLFEYVYGYSSDVFSTVLLLGSLYLVLRNRFYLGAALLGLSIFAKLPNAPLAGVILLYAGFKIFRDERLEGIIGENIRHKLMVVTTTTAIFLFALLPFAYTNYYLFGSPFVTGYQRTAEAGADGQIILVNHTDKFNQPLFTGIYRSLFDPRNGVLPTNPVFILALLGVFWVNKMRPRDQAYLILLICLTQFLLFARYDEWYMSEFSNRFLITFIALSSIFAANFLDYLAHKFSLQTSIPEQIL